MMKYNKSHEDKENDIDNKIQNMKQLFPSDEHNNISNAEQKPISENNNNSEKPTSTLPKHRKRIKSRKKEDKDINIINRQSDKSLNENEKSTRSEEEKSKFHSNSEENDQTPNTNDYTNKHQENINDMSPNKYISEILISSEKDISINSKPQVTNEKEIEEENDSQPTPLPIISKPNRPIRLISNLLSIKKPNDEKANPTDKPILQNETEPKEKEEDEDLNSNQENKNVYEKVKNDQNSLKKHDSNTFPSDKHNSSDKGNKNSPRRLLPLLSNKRNDESTPEKEGIDFIKPNSEENDQKTNTNDDTNQHQDNINDMSPNKYISVVFASSEKGMNSTPAVTDENEIEEEEEENDSQSTPLPIIRSKPTTTITPYPDEESSSDKPKNDRNEIKPPENESEKVANQITPSCFRSAYPNNESSSDGEDPFMQKEDVDPFADEDDKFSKKNDKKTKREKIQYQNIFSDLIPSVFISEIDDSDPNIEDTDLFTIHDDKRSFIYDEIQNPPKTADDKVDCELTITKTTNNRTEKELTITKTTNVTVKENLNESIIHIDIYLNGNHKTTVNEEPYLSIMPTTSITAYSNKNPGSDNGKNEPKTIIFDDDNKIDSNEANSIDNQQQIESSDNKLNDNKMSYISEIPLKEEDSSNSNEMDLVERYNDIPIVSSHSGKNDKEININIDENHFQDIEATQYKYVSEILTSNEYPVPPISNDNDKRENPTEVKNEEEEEIENKSETDSNSNKNPDESNQKDFNKTPNIFISEILASNEYPVPPKNVIEMRSAPEQEIIEEEEEVETDVNSNSIQDDPKPTPNITDTITIPSTIIDSDFHSTSSTPNCQIQTNPDPKQEVKHKKRFKRRKKKSQVENEPSKINDDKPIIKKDDKLDDEKENKPKIEPPKTLNYKQENKPQIEPIKKPDYKQEIRLDTEIIQFPKYPKNQSLEDVKKYLHNNSTPYTSITNIRMLDNELNTEYFFVLSELCFFILKKKKNSIDKSFKECVLNISLISTAIESIIVIGFKHPTLSTVKRIEFETANATIFIDSLNDHIRRILASFEIKSINYNDFSKTKPRSLFRPTTQTIIYRLESLIFLNQIKIPKRVFDTITFSIYSNTNSITFLKIKKRKKIFPMIFQTVLLNRSINQVKIIKPETIVPLFVDYFEYFENICHFIIDGPISSLFCRFISQTKNVNSISFINSKIQDFHYLTVLMKKNQIKSVGFDSSINERTFSKFIKISSFKNLSYFRVSGLFDLDFKSSCRKFTNLTVLSLTNCNLLIGDVFEIMTFYQFNYLKQVDLSGNIGRGFSNKQTNLFQKLNVLFLNDVEWEVDELIILLNILCSNSNISEVSIDNIHFLNTDSNLNKTVKKKNKTEKDYAVFVDLCWEKLLSNLPKKMNSISSFSWNSNRINEQFIEFLKRSNNLTYVSLSSCKVDDLLLIKQLNKIQSLIIRRIGYKDETFYFDQLKKFLTVIPQMSSLKHIDLSKNKFDSECFEILSNSLINSGVELVYIDHSDVTFSKDLFNFFRTLKENRENSIKISLPIHDIQRLNLSQNEINEINEELYQLSKPLFQRKSLSPYSYFSEVSIPLIRKSFPQFLSKQNLIEIEKEKSKQPLSVQQVDFLMSSSSLESRDVMQRRKHSYKIKPKKEYSSISDHNPTESESSEKRNKGKSKNKKPLKKTKRKKEVKNNDDESNQTNHLVYPKPTDRTEPESRPNKNDNIPKPNEVENNQKQQSNGNETNMPKRTVALTKSEKPKTTRTTQITTFNSIKKFNSEQSRSIDPIQILSKRKIKTKTKTFYFASDDSYSYSEDSYSYSEIEFEKSPRVDNEQLDFYIKNQLINEPKSLKDITIDEGGSTIVIDEQTKGQSGNIKNKSKRKSIQLEKIKDRNKSNEEI